MTKPDSYTFQIKSSIDDIDAVSWDTVTANATIYLDRGYLNALEKSLNIVHQFYYVLIRDTNINPVMVMVFQSAPFMYTKDKYSKKISCHFGKNKQGFFTKQLLVCGNVFATGETGFAYSKELSKSQMGVLMVEATSQVLKFQKKNDHLIKTKVTLFKEFWPDSLKIPSELKDSLFQNFQIDVTMVLPIAPQWKSFDDYLKDVKAKYRTRANSVFSKARGLKMLSLDADQIIDHALKIDVLFENVQAQSDFRFGKMEAQTFAALKRELGALFIFKGLFKDNLLVGFSTAFLNGTVLEANYVGIDYELNETHAIYQSLLYDYVAEAINNSVSSLYFGRTSELLKSSLGAVPVPMSLFAKHKNPITHALMASILKKVSASPYELRKPFKAAFYNTDLSPMA